MAARTHALLRLISFWLALFPLALAAAHPIDAPADQEIPRLLALAPQAPTEAAADFDQLLSRGIQYEQAGDWGRAVQLYEDATKTHPHSPLLRERLRQCEIRYSLSRRYRDPSFRSKLLVVPRLQALKLYGEVLRRIDESYVEVPDAKKLFRAGIDSLLAACDDDQFLKANLSDRSEEDIAAFRDRLRQWKNAAPRDRYQAEQYADSVTAMAESLLGMHAAPVLLEFVYGACDALDEYSACLTPDRLADLYAVIDGNFVGIGVELRSDDSGLLVVNVLAGSPAAEGGLRAGDHIVAIGSVSTIGLPTDEAANRLQGTDGSKVELWVLSPGEAQSRRVILRRRPVDVQSVALAQMVSPAEGIGYLQLSGFQKTTTVELERAVESLRRQGLRSLIIDLRGNPGGLLPAAVEVSGKFLGEGKIIVTTRGRADGQTQTYRANRASAWSFPLVVLIDADSASASEIFAGAMQDNHRATIVGVRSYGKGSVQSIFPLDSVDAGIRLTTAKFYSPRGRSYSHNGVSPDVPIERESTWRQGGSSPLDPANDPQLNSAIHASRQLLGRRAASR